jgi:hypothetical protein
VCFLSTGATVLVPGFPGHARNARSRSCIQNRLPLGDPSINPQENLAPSRRLDIFLAQKKTCQNHMVPITRWPKPGSWLLRIQQSDVPTIVHVDCSVRRLWAPCSNLSHTKESETGPSSSPTPQAEKNRGETGWKPLLGRPTSRCNMLRRHYILLCCSFVTQCIIAQVITWKSTAAKRKWRSGRGSPSTQRKRQFSNALPRRRPQVKHSGC